MQIFLQSIVSRAFKFLHFLPQILKCFCHFVSIHTRSWHLNGTRPVEVIVAQLMSKQLYGLFLHLRVIIWNKEVSGQRTSLSCDLGIEIEVVSTVITFTLYNMGINYSSTWRIHQISMFILNKEPLRNPFVHDHHCKGRL